ncbi:MAG: hypothetical protein R2832_14785 [Rhodothermales bacterium]
MKVVNLTKRPLVVYDVHGSPVELLPDPRHIGIVAVGDHQTIRDENGAALSINVRRVSEIKGMPEPDGNTLFVVPVEVAMVLQQSRDDIVFPSEPEVVAGPNGSPRSITHLRRIVVSRRAE